MLRFAPAGCEHPAVASHRTGTSDESSNRGRYGASLVVLTSLFFMWGLITSLNDILVPHFKAIFTLSYVQAMLIQLSFFGAYFVSSLPWGYLVERVGYQRGIVLGLLLAALGCFAFYPAASLASYPLFLGALFVLAVGITLLQVAANPCVANLGLEESAASRLNLTQAFNSLGTTLGPLLGSLLILPVAATAGSDVVTHDEIHAVQGPYLVLAAVLAAIALLFSRLRVPLTAASGDHEGQGDRGPSGSLWRQRHVVLGALGIFVYVGAEVSIGSFLVSFMIDPTIAHLPASAAGRYLSLYWGGAMVGRFVGSAALRKIKPGRMLAGNAALAMGLLLFAIATHGRASMWMVLAVGLCNSIMFPTIFTLALARLGKRSGEASGAMCMAIVGGAVVPVFMGLVADHVGLVTAFAVPVVCYAYIVHYGLVGHVPR
jgi:FHS family L-fucose permease-like MFS transporter